MGNNVQRLRLTINYRFHSEIENERLGCVSAIEVKSISAVADVVVVAFKLIYTFLQVVLPHCTAQTGTRDSASKYV